MPRSPLPARPPGADHPGAPFDGRRFGNPPPDPATPRGLRDVWRWKRHGTPSPWPDSVPVEPARPAPRVAGLRITVVGHATVLIQAANRNILTDPVWSDRASPFRFAGPRRVAAPGIRFADLPPIDAVLLSHGHYDHLDLRTLRRLHARDAPVMAVPLGLDRLLRRAIPGVRLRVGDWHDRLELLPDCATTLTPALHWHRRTPFDTNRALWCGHWLHTPAGAVYFAGDTGYGDGAVFRDLRRRHGPPAFALVPIGAYAPRWFMRGQHVDPAEAVRIVRDLGDPPALGLHWGVFRLTDEARDDPPRELATALRDAGLPPDRFLPAAPGAVHDLVP